MNAFLDPAVLFFAIGIGAGLLRSNLEIPPPVSRFLALYLLMALGLKGGFALAKSGLVPEVATSLGCAIALALAVPALGFAVLRRFVSGYDALAIAATYGSVSAVTFVTATQYLDGRGIVYGGHMAAAMALMESPAILLAVVAANLLRRSARAVPAGMATAGAGGGFGGSAGGIGGAGAGVAPLGRVLHESLTDGAQLLLLGSMLVGLLSGDAGKSAMEPFTGNLFKGMLSFFLLDMGLLTARNLGRLHGQPPALLAYALGAPIVHACLALALAGACGLAAGNAALLAILAASASYIAVPAVLRQALPEANPSLYFGMSLGITFPFNILLGIPLYVSLAQRFAA